jgi:hypothetical protein
MTSDAIIICRDRVRCVGGKTGRAYNAKEVRIHSNLG